ncbi:MAG: hypothetical protein ACYCUY_04110, partial [Acidithiobacillus sp.]
MSLLIKNGTVVNADRSFEADVYCESGKIVAVEKGLNAPHGAEIIDARAWAEKSCADYSFHVAITWWDESVHEDMGTLVG